MTPRFDWDALRAAAVRAMEHAYAPYSTFRVGAALGAADGDIHVGCNVENAAYPSGLCAERAALAAAVVAGSHELVALVVTTEADDPTPPCGMCRQVLAELAPDVEILSVTRDGSEARWTIAQLLPTPFTSRSLDHHA